MRKLLFSLVTLGLVASAPAQVVINEFLYDPLTPATDAGEFIELYNPSASAVDISGYTVVLVNGANGVAYLTTTIPAATSLAAGGYYVLGNATSVDANFGAGTVDQNVNYDNILQNGGADAIVLRDSTSARIDSANVEADTAMPAGADQAHAIAEGGMGRFVSPDATAAGTSGGRLPNGVDTGSNLQDFAPMFPTPGAANVGATLPITDSFTVAANAAWQRNFVGLPLQIVAGATDPGVASTDGGNVMKNADLTGGGDANNINGAFSQINFTGEIFIPNDNALGWSTGLGIATRMEPNWFSNATTNGLENGFYLEYQNNTAATTITKLGATHGGSAVFFQGQAAGTLNTGLITGYVNTPLGSPTTGVNKNAWNPFRLVFDKPSNLLYASLNNNVLYAGPIPAGSNNSGGITVGFREEHAGTPTATGEATYIDGITLDTNTFFVPPSSTAIDGVITSGEYGAGFQLAVQTVQTSFGDANNPAPDAANGSEADSISIRDTGDDLIIGIAGSFETNGNFAAIFIDADSNGASGATTIPANPFSFAVGTVMPTGFGCDVIITPNAGGPGQTAYCNAHTFDGTISSDFIGSAAGTAGLPTTGTITGNVEGVSRSFPIAYDNRNTAGVEAGTAAATGNAANVFRGLEIAIPRTLLRSNVPIGPQTQIKVFVAITGGSFFSNQVLPPLATPGNHLGTAPNLSANSVITYNFVNLPTSVETWEAFEN